MWTHSCPGEPATCASVTSPRYLVNAVNGVELPRVFLGEPRMFLAEPRMCLPESRLFRGEPRPCANAIRLRGSWLRLGGRLLSIAADRSMSVASCCRCLRFRRKRLADGRAFLPLATGRWRSTSHFLQRAAIIRRDAVASDSQPHMRERLLQLPGTSPYLGRPAPRMSAAPPRSVAARHRNSSDRSR